MPTCPNCEAFFPEISDLKNHRQEDCRGWTKAQVFSILMLQCDGTKNRVANYEMRLELINELVGHLGDGKRNDSVFKMLLAPEFFFWNELGSPQGVFSSDAAAECFGALAKLSARVGKILLVPGTIPIADSFAFEDLKLHYERLEGVKIARGDLLPGGVARKYLNEEWAEQLKYTSKTNKTFLYRNVLGGFYDSRQIIEYQKQIPYSSSDDFEYHWDLDQAAMVMGLAREEHRRSSIVVGGVKLGFEICAEHQYGTLMASGSGPPDVHILLANSMEEKFDQLVYTRPTGGLFAHVDAKSAHCKLYYAQDGKLAKIRPKKKMVLNEKGFSGTVLCYQETLRIPVRFV